LNIFQTDGNYGPHTHGEQAVLQYRFVIKRMVLFLVFSNELLLILL